MCYFWTSGLLNPGLVSMFWVFVAPVALPLLVYSVHVHSLRRNKKRPLHAGNTSHQVEDLCGLQ